MMSAAVSSTPIVPPTDAPATAPTSLPCVASKAAPTGALPVDGEGDGLAFVAVIELVSVEVFVAKGMDVLFPVKSGTSVPRRVSWHDGLE